MGQLLYDLAIEVCHENIIGLIQRPYIFIAILSSIRYGRTFITPKMRRRIDYMLAIFGEERTGGSSFSGTDQFIFKLITWFFRDLSHKDLVTLKAFLWIGTLENNVFAIEAPVSL